jgi:methyl-accepting chemotaxis protein
MSKSRQKIQTKLILSTSLLTGAGLILISGFILTQSIKVYKEETFRSVQNQANAQAYAFQDKINPIAVKLKTLVNLPYAPILNPRENNREIYYDYIRAHFKDGDDFAFNQWIAVIPGYIDAYEMKDDKNDLENYAAYTLRVWNGIETPLVGQGYDPFEYDSWWNIPYNSRKMVITEPYFWDYKGDIGNIFITSICAPVVYDGKSIGVGGYDMNLSYFQDKVAEIHPYEGSFAILYTTGGTIVGYEEEALGKALTEYFPVFEGKDLRSGGFFEHEGYWYISAPMKMRMVDDPWMLTIAVPEEEIMVPFRRMVVLVSAILIITLLSMVILIYIFARSISKPIEKIAASFEEIAAGDADLTKRLDIKSEDEMGIVADKFNAFVDKLRMLVGDSLEAVEETLEIEKSLAGNTDNTNGSIREIDTNIRYLRDQLDKLNRNLNESVSATEQISSNVESFDGQIINQSAMVEESTSAITEMITSLGNVESITKSKKVSVGQLVEMMRDGKMQLEQTKTGFAELVGKVGSISEMASVIQSIASQTNLLSMNAAIEAAHAGESGRGFAVVAEEIRKLADSSGNSSSHIARLVDDIEAGIKQSDGNVQEVDAAFGRISSEIQSTTDAFNEIEYSISELNLGGNQILKSSNEINNATVSIRDGSVEIRNGINSLMQAAENLKSVAEDVSREIEKIASESGDIQDSMGAIVDLNENLNSVINVLKRHFGHFVI